jgi:hypothetical protein
MQNGPCRDEKGCDHTLKVGKSEGETRGIVEDLNIAFTDAIAHIVGVVRVPQWKQKNLVRVAHNKLVTGGSQLLSRYELRFDTVGDARHWCNRVMIWNQTSATCARANPQEIAAMLLIKVADSSFIARVLSLLGTGSDIFIKPEDIRVEDLHAVAQVPDPSSVEQVLQVCLLPSTGAAIAWRMRACPKTSSRIMNVDAVVAAEGHIAHQKAGAIIALRAAIKMRDKTKLKAAIAVTQQYEHVGTVGYTTQVDKLAMTMKQSKGLPTPRPTVPPTDVPTAAPTVHATTARVKKVRTVHQAVSKIAARCPLPGRRRRRYCCCCCSSVEQSRHRKH